PAELMADPTNPSDPDVGPFATTFKRFMDAMVAQATSPESALLIRIREHLGAEPTQLPVVVEEFDPFEQPNLQRALDDYVAGEGRQATLHGVAAENKRYMAVGLSDLFGRMHLTEGPVDYVNYSLAGGDRLSCVQFGLYLVRDGDATLVAFVAGPTERMG